MDFDVAMTVLRLALGVVIVAHGTQKLFGWFGGGGIPGTAKYMESLAMHPPRLQAGFAGCAETLAGTLLILGFLMPLAAAALIAVMLTAIATVHFKNGFFNTNGGLEFPLSLMAGAFTLACVGPGWLSLDNLVGVNWASWQWAVIALIVAAAGSFSAVEIGRHSGTEEHLEESPPAHST